jgi:hypothetical protein
MNLQQRIRERAASRFLILAIGAGVTAGFLGGLAAVVLTAIAMILVPVAVTLCAYFWAHSSEWTRLAIAEEYGQIAQRLMDEAARRDLRATLDPLGVEALEEVERAIERREQDQAHG